MTYPVVRTHKNATLRAEITDENLVFLHLEYNGDVSPEVFKELQEVFSEVLDNYGNQDVPCVFCCIPEDKERRKKLVESFGFIEEGRAEGLILYKAETF